LYQYQKIERIKDLAAYKEYVKSRKNGTFHDAPEEPTVTVTPKKTRKKLTPVLPPDPPEETAEEAEG
jgi:hypothetical protein